MLKNNRAGFLFDAALEGCSPSDAVKAYNKTQDCACGLSTGAIVGIVVGSLAFIALVIFLVVRYGKRGKKRKKK
jgi:hypothetical protein